MAEWLLLAIIFVVLFTGGWVVANYVFKIFATPTEDDKKATREAEALKVRAEENVERAQELAARAKRLEQLMRVQQRQEQQTQRKWRWQR